MTDITLRVLDGADRGRVFENLSLPVTIGREDGNVIQLCDERISRYHIKIQEDHGKLVLTDLESTNGTRVNGEDIQLRILRYGDVISLGRSVLLYGTREQIASRLAELRLRESSGDDTMNPGELAQQMASPSLDFELGWGDNSNLQSTLHLPFAPELPEHLSPGQAAQVSELMEYLHIRIRHLIDSVQIKSDTEQVILEPRQWQNLLDLQSQLAEYLRAIGDPHHGDE